MARTNKKKRVTRLDRSRHTPRTKAKYSWYHNIMGTKSFKTYLVYIRTFQPRPSAANTYRQSYRQFMGDTLILPAIGSFVFGGTSSTASSAAVQTPSPATTPGANYTYDPTAGAPSPTSSQDVDIYFTYLGKRSSPEVDDDAPEEPEDYNPRPIKRLKTNREARETTPERKTRIPRAWFRPLRTKPIPRLYQDPVFYDFATDSGVVSPTETLVSIIFEPVATPEIVPAAESDIPSDSVMELAEDTMQPETVVSTTPEKVIKKVRFHEAAVQTDKPRRTKKNPNARPSKKTVDRGVQTEAEVKLEHKVKLQRKATLITRLSATTKGFQKALLRVTGRDKLQWKPKPAAAATPEDKLKVHLEARLSDRNGLNLQGVHWQCNQPGDWVFRAPWHPKARAHEGGAEFWSLVNAHFQRDNKRTIAGVNLSGNSLQDLECLATVSTALPNMTRLNLSCNEIASWEELDWIGAVSETQGANGKPEVKPFRYLEALWLEVNPLAEQYIAEFAQDGYEREIVKRFPTLKFLDGKPITLPAITPLAAGDFDNEETRMGVSDAGEFEDSTAEEDPMTIPYAEHVRRASRVPCYCTICQRTAARFPPSPPPPPAPKSIFRPRDPNPRPLSGIYLARDGKWRDRSVLVWEKPRIARPLHEPVPPLAAEVGGEEPALNGAGATTLDDSGQTTNLSAGKLAHAVVHASSTDEVGRGAESQAPSLHAEVFYTDANGERKAHPFGQSPQQKREFQEREAKIAAIKARDSRINDLKTKAMKPPKRAKFANKLTYELDEESAVTRMRKKMFLERLEEGKEKAAKMMNRPGLGGKWAW
ncbi:hypothetical protein IAT38_001343 [Cryptococcus sp. DSM 104549]